MQIALLMGAKESSDAAMIVKEGKWTLNFWKINFQAWTAQGKLEIAERKLEMCATSEMKRPVMEISIPEQKSEINEGNFGNDK